MKFVFFGLTLSSAWGNGHATPYRSIVQALRRLGHDVAFYEKDVPYYASHRDLRECNFCDLILYPDWEAIREQALRDAQQADVVITASYLPEGQRINHELAQLSGPTKIFYDLDTPITLAHWTRGDHVEYLRRDQLPLFDLVLSFTGGRILEELTRLGAQRALPLFGCVDSSIHRRVAPEPEFTCDLSYMGTFAPDRHHKVEELLFKTADANPAMSFLLAGSLYPWEMEIPQNVRRFDHVQPDHHSALYSSSSATLNITRAAMAEWGYCPSGRFFEAAACGTPLISDWWEGLDDFFSDGSEIFIADTAGEVAAALRLPLSDLRRMGNLARERTLDEHTGDVRARQLLAAVDTARDRDGILEAAS